TDTTTNTITGTTSVVVSAAAATQLGVSATANATAGSPFNVTVASEDACGNVATGYTGTVHFTSSDPRATLPADFTFTAADNGTHTFTNGVTLLTAGGQTITA